MPPLTATAAEARADFSKIASTVYETGRPITVFKNSKPWVTIVSPVIEEYSEDYYDEIDRKIELSRSQIASGNCTEGKDEILINLAQERPEIWS